MSAFYILTYSSLDVGRFVNFSFYTLLKLECVYCASTSNN